jgi:hypothetical protein
LFIDDRGAELFDTEGGQGGIRAGSFDIRAALGISFGYDSNVYAQPDAGNGQATGIAEALVRATDHSATRDILGMGYVRARRYNDTRDQDATEYGAIGSYDGWLNPQDRITSNLSAERNIESRTDIETPTSIALSPYDDLRGSFGYAHLFNRLGIESQFDIRRVQYDNNTQAFRDRSQYRGELRGAYAFRSNLSWVLSGYYSHDEFDEPTLTTPSANTAGGLLGLRYEVRDLLQLEIDAGYFERRYDEEIAPLNGVAVRGQMTWFPTRLTTVRAQVLRTDAPTRVEGAVGKIRNDALFSVNHEYSRSLLLHAGARFVADDFQGLSRTDTAWMAELGLTWSFGRHSVIQFVYDYGNRANETPDRSFERHVATLAYIGRL